MFNKTNRRRKSSGEKLFTTEGRFDVTKLFQIQLNAHVQSSLILLKLEWASYPSWEIQMTSAEE